MADPDSSILSHLNSAFINNLLPEAREYLATVPAKMSTTAAGSRYNPFTGNTMISPTASRQEIEEEALHALTLGMGKGSGLERGIQSFFYPGSWFGFSDKEKDRLQGAYTQGKLPVIKDILWLSQRGKEAGPSSWNLAGGDFSAMPQAAQEELGKFFTAPPLPPLIYDAGYQKPSLKEVSQTPASTPGPGSFLKVNQAPLPAPPAINKRRYNIRRAPKRTPKVAPRPRTRTRGMGGLSRF